MVVLWVSFGMRDCLLCFAGVVLVFFVLVFGLVLVISCKFQVLFVDLLMEVVDVVRAIVRNQDYAVWVRRCSEDEVGFFGLGGGRFVTFFVEGAFDWMLVKVPVLGVW